MRTQVVVLLALCAVANAAIDADLITNLPGWSPKPFNSKHYSGYLDVGAGKHLHYWFVESESTPSSDPVVIWMNGGPGCSSLDGFLYEMGPLHVQTPLPPDNKTIPTLYLNEHRWNKISSMLYLEAPACVGFSYADTDAGCYNNDTQQAIDNLAALQAWYKGFPEYASNPLFITGESYAGVYVPTLALQILKNAPSIPLRGIAVGNGVIGAANQERNRLNSEYLHGHGLFQDSVWASMLNECKDWRNPSSSCSRLIQQAHQQVGHVNIYNIYGDCINDGFPPSEGKERPKVWRRPLDEFEQMLYSQVGGPDACIDAGAASNYLNRPEIKSALHVKGNLKWEICTNRLHYTTNQPSLLPDYKNTLIPKIRVLIYNGEADACVPYNGNEEWTASLGVPVRENWRAWLVDKQVAGYVTGYQSNFNFVTIKGAGHMVPQTHPPQAFAMFQRFIQNQPF